MRIAFVAHDELRPTSGGNIYDRHLVEGLRALGDTVQVIAAPASTAMPGETPAAWAAPLAGYDCLVEDQLLHPALLPVHRQVRAAGLPVVALVHNLTSRQPRQEDDQQTRQTEQAYFHSVDAVVAVCQQTLTDVRACGGQGLPALVACPGRDPGSSPARTRDQVAARAHTTGPLRVLFVGVVAPHKGLHRLLQVVAGLSPDQVTLDVAGWLDRDGHYVKHIRSLVAGLDLGGRVRLHGGLVGPALQALYDACHVLALPSDREAYPLVGVEALGHGLPLLLTDRGGTWELLRGSGATPDPGVLLDPDDPIAWADQLRRWHADRAALASAALAALDRYQAHRSWSDTAASVRQFLRGIKLRSAPGEPPGPA